MKKIFTIGIFAFILVLGITIFGMYLSYNNQEVRLRNLAEAQRGKVESNFDAMWKIISQQAQVTSEYKDAFKEIYPELIAGRYSNGNGQFMQWIKENSIITIAVFISLIFHSIVMLYHKEEHIIKEDIIRGTRL